MARWWEKDRRTSGRKMISCALLYLMCKLEGKGAYPIRHLVIDEAQDMSALGFLAVKQLTAMDTFTVVGDVRQKIKGHHPSQHDGCVGEGSLQRRAEAGAVL